jgi:hypothetical protein
VPHSDRPYMPGYGIEPSVDGAGLLPWSWAAERLGSSRHVWIASVNDDGTPHQSAVWFVWLDGALHFSCGGRSRKARNLAKRPACSAALADPLESLVLQGPTQRHESAATIATVDAAYQAKYGSGFPDPDESPLLTLLPRVAIAVIEAEFTTAATRWTFDDGPPSHSLTPTGPTPATTR